MYDYRENWLAAAVDLLRADFGELGREVPPVRVSCGWPARRALGARVRRIGECWAPEASTDNHAQIFISPSIECPIEALGVLTHELVHAVVGVQYGHGRRFARVARALGLEGPMTATVVGKALRERLGEILQALGPYPHGAIGIGGKQITPNGPRLTSGPKPQRGRMLKAQCPRCGYTVRTTRRWLDVGLPTCPCGTSFVEE